MKKKLFVVLMAAITAASMTGCAGSTAETTKAAPDAGTTTEAVTTVAASEAGEGTAGGDNAETKAETKAEADKAGGILTMATNAEFPPYEFHEGGEIVGIDAEIAQAIADKLGMELKIEDMSFDAIIPSVTSGKADFGAAGLTITEDRKLSVDFTETYATSTQVAIVQNDSEIADQAGLKGKIIGVQLGTTGDSLAGDIEGATIERYSKGMEAVQSLKQGKIDAVVIDEETAKAFVANTEGIKILDEKMTEEEYALALKKGNTELLGKMNAAIKELKEEGKLDEIVAKYIKAE